MGKVSTAKSSRKSRPSLNPDSRENLLISLATDVAEEQLRNGTASAQVIVHYLKLGSAKARLEKELLREQVDLVKAKTEAYKASEHADEMYEKAINAMKSYGSGVVMSNNDSDVF